MVSIGGEGSGGLIAGRYRLGARLGRGGMGTVWRATDQLLGREVAVKELRLEDDLPDEDCRLLHERTLREARTVAQFHHPNVVVVHDVVEQDERPWIVMELVDGRPLSDLLATDGPLDPREAARIGLALLGALRVAHAHGVLHRDIKPANVLIEEGTGRVVLTDFGIARIADSTTITETGTFVGSPEYTAPERMSGGPTGPESDLWSLGVLLCAALSGRSPFHRHSLGAVLHAVVYEDVIPPEAAAPLLPVVRGLLERDPARRLDAAAAEWLLSEYLRTGRMPDAWSATTRQHGAAAPPGRWRVARARAAVTAALLVVAAGGAGVAAVAMLMDPGGGATAGGQSGANGDGSRPTGTHLTPSPTVTVTETSTAPPTLPQGYRTVTDPTGFRLAVPEGFTRSYERPRVYYYSPGKRFRLGIHIQRSKPGGALAAMRQADAEGPDHYRGYRAGSVTRTTHDGHPAALWEFTWDGFPSDGGPRHTFDLSWDEDGRMYDIWISAPAGEQASARRHFDVALSTFVHTAPSS